MNLSAPCFGRLVNILSTKSILYSECNCFSGKCSVRKRIKCFLLEEFCKIRFIFRLTSVKVTNEAVDIVISMLTT